MIKTIIKSFLWVVPAWPFPPEDGAAVARANLIKSLVDFGYNIDLLVISSNSQLEYKIPEDLALAGVHSIRTVSENNKYLKYFKYLLMSFIHPWTPAVMLRFSQRKIKTAVNHLLTENPNKWDAMVYDGLHSAGPHMVYGKYKRPDYPKAIIYRAHNVESGIWYRMAEQQTNVIKKLFLKLQAKRIIRFEKSLLKAADAVACVSPQDLIKLEHIQPQMKGGTVPISFNFTAPLEFPNSQQTLHIMFLGRLDWLPNKDGLTWFLTEVWPKIITHRRDLHLSIAGSGDSSWMKKYSQLPQLSFLGRVDRIDTLYQQSCLMIVPIFYGSGTRVKIIESCSFGRACLSTTVGAEGIGLEDGDSYYCANDQNAWIECLKTLNSPALKIMGAKAFDAAQNLFGHAAARDEFIKLLTI